MKKSQLMKVLLSGAMISSSALSYVGPTTVLAAEDTNTVTHESLTDKTVAAPKKDSVLPSPNQYKYQKDELAAFCHFGPNTFTGKEWGDDYGNKQPQEIFWLKDDFDAESLVKTLKTAGFTKLIVTAKHHDGFCIWQSNETEYDMGGISSYKNGKGDILKEISAACTRHDMDMGLYLSPWDIHDKSYGYKDEKGNSLVHEENGKTVPNQGLTWDDVKRQDALDYNEYYNKQLIEILGNKDYGNKGRFTEVWMDGAKGSGSSYQEYTFKTWFDTIQKYEGKQAGYNDDCLLFGAEAHTTVRWIGNEHGFAANETWSKSKVDTANNTIDSNGSEAGYFKGFADGNKWTVPESDARITSGWFWGQSKKTPKSMEALSEMYFRSVGHNSPLLLNIPPNDQGKVDPAILNRLAEFGKNIKDSFSKNLAEGATVYASNVRNNATQFSPNNLLDQKDDTYWTVDDGQSEASVTLKLKESTTFDVVSIEESIEFGQRIGHYKVEYRKNGEAWKTFEEGPTVGAKRLCRKQAVTADEVRITVTAHDKAENKTPILNAIGLYKATADMAAKNAIPSSLNYIDDRKFTANNWNQETGEQFVDSTGMWSDVKGQEASVTFTGTKAWVIGTLDKKHGTADIYIDNKKVDSINTYASSRKLGQVLYETPDLSEGQHTLKIVNTGSGDRKAIGLDALAYVNNGGKGVLQIEYPSYTVNEGVTVPIKVKRVGGTKGKTEVNFQVNPGSAWQDHFNADGNMKLVFEDGQSEAMAQITTKRVPGVTGDLNFSMELVEPTNGVTVGFNSPSMVTILDTEDFTKDKLKDKINAAKPLEAKASEYTTVSFKAFQDALKAAEKVLNKPNVTKQACAQAANNLDIAMRGLVKRATFTEKDPFVFPSRINDSKVVEAEYGILDGSKAQQDKYLRVEKGDQYSNGAKVGWFEPGNKLTIPFTAQKPGTYTVEVTYETGRGSNNPNELVMKSNQFEQTEYKKSVHTDGNDPVIKTVSFDVKVKEAGYGELVFEANEKGSPNLDKIVITAKEVKMDSYKITTSVEGNGSISETTDVVEGQSHTVTMTPQDKQTVVEVYVDGEAVGPCLTYKFDDVSRDHTIKAVFGPKALTEDNRFEFPVLGQTATAEAERFELHNTGDSSEQWKLEVKADQWASMGEFVNSMNGQDTMKFYYNAQQPGVYDVTLYYRSGSTANNISWSEADGKVKEGRVVAGHNDSNVTKEVQLTFEVVKKGPGVITFATDGSNAPQMDKFVITNNQEPLNIKELGKVIAEAKALDLKLYEDGQSKDDFNKALELAEKVLADAQKGETTQAIIDNATTQLVNARQALRLIPQTPQVNKEELAQAIESAKKVDLSLYKDDNAKVEFKDALANAIKVYENANATEEDVFNALNRLNKAQNSLNLIQTGGTTVTPKPDNNTNKPSQGEQGSTHDKVETSDNTSFMAVTTLVMATLGLVLLRKKKENV